MHDANDTDPARSLKHPMHFLTVETPYWHSPIVRHTTSFNYIAVQAHNLTHITHSIQAQNFKIVLYVGQHKIAHYRASMMDNQIFKIRIV